jgi:CDP-diacylglycerol--serine O-phosphatidyltransferase
LWLALVGLCGFLMVSTWRFWSAKEINFSRAHPFQLLFVLAIVVFIMGRYSNVVFFAIGATYMFSGIWARAAYSWSRRRRRGAGAVAVADDHSVEAESAKLS